MNNWTWQQLENEYYKHHDPYDDDLYDETEFHCIDCDTHWCNDDNVCPLCGQEVEK